MPSPSIPERKSSGRILLSIIHKMLLVFLKTPKQEERLFLVIDTGVSSESEDANPVQDGGHIVRDTESTLGD